MWYTLLDNKTIRERIDLQHVQQSGLWSSHFLLLLDQMHIILRKYKQPNSSITETQHNH